MQPAADLGEFDHAAIASAVGCRASRPTNANELALAIKDMLASDVPFVIDVATSPDVTYRSVEAMPRLDR
jgi:thiamine pyrophosphate-dependent acetolactate synthase large subunit-like protein